MGKEKKEIGMEKLIELLNECQKENKRPIFYNYNKESDFFECGSISGIQTFGESGLTIISKRFGFIKWLVENDKILETEVRPIQIYDYEGKYCDDEFGYSWFNQGLYYRVIMELAISDTPIEDLISYLK